MTWLTTEQIELLGFASVGKSVLLSDKSSYHNCPNISIGNYTRIDDFCVLSAGVGGIFIGRNVHIAVYSLLMGAGKITLCDFSNISSRVAIYSSNDDYTGASMTNPTIPVDFTNFQHADVTIGRHSMIGSGSIILPGVTLETGVAIGALSLVKKDCKEFGLYAGIPSIRVAERKTGVLKLEKDFLQQFP